jgi:hypothetical protein
MIRLWRCGPLLLNKLLLLKVKELILVVSIVVLTSVEMCIGADMLRSRTLPLVIVGTKVSDNEYRFVAVVVELNCLV